MATESRACGSEEAPAADTVVVSGMSGLLPGCHHLMDFYHKLYDKENLVKCSPARWQYSHPEVPDHYGQVSGLECFDAQFFRVHYKLGQAMDVISRKILEQAYQAIFDAGISPSELAGKHVGVYIGSCFSESEKKCCFYEVELGILGSSRTMYANRISYWLDVKGPSMVVDAACCSALVALEHAQRALAAGECDAALVAGSRLLLHPPTCVQHNRLMPLNSDGNTKCYDKSADGLSLSEAIGVLFLQKYKDAKRTYGTVCHVKTGYGGVGEKFGPYPDTARLTNFIQEFYDEVTVLPSKVQYVEGYGAGNVESDSAELEAIASVYCKEREEPLLVGSVTSNVGYTEAAGGIVGIMKILLAYHKGEFAANLHCDQPCEAAAAAADGESARMRVVSQHARCSRAFAALNHFSVTGVNAHVLLRGMYKPKDRIRYDCSFPRLVTVSARQETGVHKILDDLKSRPVDAEEIALLHNIHKMHTSGHLARGFGIFDMNDRQETTVLKEGVDYFDDVKRPLWFVYSGMGSQWSGMGEQLLRVPAFAAAIQRCCKVLKPLNVDLLNILTSRDPDVLNNILNSFIGIAAVQIGLTDVLRSVGLVPDKIIGHSLGEMGCAYADGCFTTEETILCAYNRGRVSFETQLIRGSMAAVGIGHKEISKLCPPEVTVACHNGPHSSTISGPADIMKVFVSQLTAQGIFAREVPCSNIAYHSKYISDAGPSLLKYLKQVIKFPKLRSERWLSTSVPQDKWLEQSAMYSSAEYHTNNLLNPVLFEEVLKLAPSNAVLVEIAPHGLMQAILKRALPSSCHNIALTRRAHKDNVLLLLEGLGKLYMDGFNFDVSALYPPIEFPVSTETRPLSHLVEWVHTEKCCRKKVFNYIQANSQCIR